MAVFVVGKVGALVIGLDNRPTLAICQEPQEPHSTGITEHTAAALIFLVKQQLPMDISGHIM